MQYNGHEPRGKKTLSNHFQQCLNGWHANGMITDEQLQLAKRNNEFRKILVAAVTDHSSERDERAKKIQNLGYDRMWELRIKTFIIAPPRRSRKKSQRLR